MILHKQQTLILHGYRSWKVQDQGVSMVRFGESPLPFFTDSHPLLHLHMAEREQANSLALSYKGSNPNPEGSTLIIISQRPHLHHNGD